MTAQLTVLGITQRSRLDRLSSLWLAIRQPVTIIEFAEWYLIVLAVFCWCHFDLLTFSNPPNYLAEPTPIKLQTCHVVVFWDKRSSRYGLVHTAAHQAECLPWIEQSSRIYSPSHDYYQLWFEITKVTWKSGCKKANRDCVLLQTGDMEN